MSVYDYTVTSATGEKVNLKDYEGQVLLIVNTATECGFTPSYEDLQKLYVAYKDQGFTVLDFPCDQFGHQAPGTNEEIAKFCTSRFGTTFPQFDKCEVNGEHALPLFNYLKGEKGFNGFDPNHPITPILEDMFNKSGSDWKNSSDIKWNFTKFLIGKDGNVVARFEPTEPAANVDAAVKALL